MSAPFSRIYAVLDSNDELLKSYRSRDFEGLKKVLSERLDPDMNFDLELELPSSNWSLEGVDKLIISIKLSSDDARSDSLKRIALDTKKAAFANVPITA